MTELQMGLLGLGAIAVVGVLGYNKWQEVRQRKAAEQAMKASHPDVLLEMPSDDTVPVQTREPEAFSTGEPLTTGPEIGSQQHYAPQSGERIEPVFGDETFPAQPPSAPEEDDSAVVEGGAAAGVPSPVASSVSVQQEIPPSSRQPAANRQVTEPQLLAPHADFIAGIDAVEPAPASRIAEAQRDLQARVRKPVRFVGYNEESGEWEQVSGDNAAEYRHLRVGLQLANRQGPVSDDELSVFSVAVQDLADQLMGLVELPHRQPALDVAAKLDEFCAGVDIQIGINVISQGQSFPGTKLRALAEAAGMTLDAGKRFVRRDDDGNVLYVLLNQDPAGFSAETIKTLSAQGLTFLLDVPCVAHGERVFNQMVDTARRFADALHGALVDDNRQPLSEKGLEPIRKQIAHYQAVLAENDLPAGSSLARRLFS